MLMAATGSGRFVAISSVAEQLNVSLPFVTTVLQQFTQAGIVLYDRGLRGGVMLARGADAVTLYEMICVIDGVDLFTEWMLGLPECRQQQPCPAYERWVDVRRKFVVTAQQTTLQTLAAEVGKHSGLLEHTDVTHHGTITATAGAS